MSDQARDGLHNGAGWGQADRALAAYDEADHA